MQDKTSPMKVITNVLGRHFTSRRGDIPPFEEDELNFRVPIPIHLMDTELQVKLVGLVISGLAIIEQPPPDEAATGVPAPGTGTISTPAVK